MPPVLWLSLGGLFISIALITGIGIQLVFFGRTSAQRRVREIAPAAVAAGLIVDPVRLTERVDPRLERIAKSIPKSPKEMSRLRRRLGQAGIYHFSAAVIYSLSEPVRPPGVSIPPFLVY